MYLLERERRNPRLLIWCQMAHQPGLSWAGLGWSQELAGTQFRSPTWVIGIQRLGATTWCPPGSELACREIRSQSWASDPDTLTQDAGMLILVWTTWPNVTCQKRLSFADRRHHPQHFRFQITKTYLSSAFRIHGWYGDYSRHSTLVDRRAAPG